MKTKITVIAILAMALVMMIGCNLVSEVQSIQLVNPPAASYELNEKVSANEFEVTVVVGGQEMTWSLTDSRLTVEGLVNGMLDTATPGVKTLKITYMGVTITATYIVEGQNESAEVYTGEFLDKLIAGGTVELTADVDLSGKQWPAVALDKDLTINGNGYTIKGLTMTNAAVFAERSDKDGKLVAENCNAGLIATVAEGKTLTVNNLKFDGVVIEHTSQKQGEYSKNFGVVVGESKGTVVINNVDVTNTTIRGNGRIGLVGCVTKGEITITGCDVVATLTGYNPVAVTSAEGEADKIGALIGQIQNGKATLTDNDVTVVINGTRDCGGLVGYVHGNVEITIDDCHVRTGSIIALSIEGGMNGAKGKRHAGGIIGTWAYVNAAHKFTYTNSSVAEDVTISINQKYLEISSKGEIIGGFRGTVYEINNPFYVEDAE